jgi:hypothetical protein
VPTTAGTYEFRYLLNNGYTDVKRSGPILVGTQPSSSRSQSGSYEGFGAEAVEGKNIYRVTNLNDSGPGTLRDCVSQRDRKCVFDVSGTINLNTELSISKPFVTVDGLTAPSPGITVTNSIYIKDATLTPTWIPHNDTHDVIVRGIRIKKNNDGGQWALACLGGFSSERDQTTRPPYNIVFSQISIAGAMDDQLALTQNCNSVTLDRLAFFDARGVQNALFDNAYRISLHRTFFGSTSYRNPQIQWHADSAQYEAPPDTMADVRNNLVFMRHASGYGISFWRGGLGNVINTLFLHALPGIARGLNNAIHVCTTNGVINPRATSDCSQPAAGVYINGNLFFSAYASEPLAMDLNILDYAAGSPPAQFPAPAVRTTQAFAAACEVLATAGMFPRLAEEQQEIDLAAKELAKFGRCYN